MGSYVPSTQAERLEMLKAIGLNDYRDLYKDVPAEMYLENGLDLPEGMSELEVRRAVAAMADKGVEQAMLDDPHLCRGLTSYRGMLTLEETARKYHMEYTAPRDAILKGMDH